MKISCPYCNKEALLVNGDIIYPHRPDLSEKKFWYCRPCGAYVGTHANSKRHIPLGRLANEELRKYKSLAHAAFDPLWKAKMAKDGMSKTKARRAGYEWLSGELGLEVKKCHIGSANVDICKRYTR